MDRPAENISTQQLGRLIGEFRQKHKEKGINFTAKHFLEFDISKKSTCRYIDGHETQGTTDRKKGSGGHNRKMTYIKELKVRKSFDHNSHYLSCYGGPTSIFEHPNEKFVEVY